MTIQIAEAKVLDSNGTYLINGSVLPVFMNGDGDTYIIEDYEGGDPCEHTIKDLIHDGVMIAVHPTGFNK